MENIMRKSVFMGLGLALSLAGVAAAQQPADSAHARRERGGQWEGRRGPGGPMGLLFKDISLSDAQKTQVKQLRDAQRTKFEANRDAMKKQFDQARALREKGDTVGARAIMDKNRAAMQQARDQEFASIRNILTADQRTQFDKNVADLKQREAQRGFGRGRGRDRDRKPGQSSEG